MARLAVVAVVASTVVVTTTAGSASPQSAPAGDEGVVSFGAAPEVAPAAMSPNEAAKLAGAVRSRFVDIPAGSIAPSLDGGTVDLELFDGVTVSLKGDGAPTAGANGSTTWSGLADNGDYATFTFIDGVVYATAAVDGHVYDISPVSGKTHLIVEDGREFPDEAEPIVAPDPTGDTPTGPEAPGVESGGTPRVDVLIWYDNAARDFYGGDTNAFNELTATINETNEIYARSGANLTLAALIEHVDYSGSGSCWTELDRLSGIGGDLADLDEVHARRDATDADLVSLITDLTGSCTGRAYVGGPSSGSGGFSVVDAEVARAPGKLVFAHELGHNLGAGHGMGDGGGVYTYSNGYRDDANGFRTIMAVEYHDDGCPGGACQRIGYFSSPSVLYDGHPTGTATQDNARTLSERAPIVAAYRPRSSAAPNAPSLLSAGGDHTCSISNRGAVHCWGRSDYGKLGYATTNNIGDNEAPGSVGPVDLGAGRTAVDVTTGFDHSCAILDTGGVRCWGYGSALGYGNTVHIGDDETPGSAGPVDLGPGRTAVQISAGYEFTCAVLDDGTVRCWGVNGGQPSWGNLGLTVPCWFGGLCPSPNIGDDETPGSVDPVNLGGVAVSVSAGYSHACALMITGSVRCWGDNPDGRLGYGNTNDVGDNEDPASVDPVDLGAPAVAISAGLSHTCAILVGGSVRCWGYNGEGQLGYGNTTNVGDNESPATAGPIDFGPGRTAVQIDATYRHTCALLDNGSIECWGKGSSFIGSAGVLGYGNLNDVGDDETPGSVGPVDLGPGRTVVQVSAGAEHTCAVLDNDAVRCWGLNLWGQLGLGNTTTIGDDETPAAAANVALVGVAGTVTEAGTGARVPGAFVAVLRSTDFAIAGGAVADGTGNFTVPVGEGSYFLYVIDPTGVHVTGFHGAPTMVTVPDGGLTDADPVMARQRGSITATVTRTGTSTRISGVWGLALSASMATTGATELAVTANGSGQLTLPGLTPGNHYVGYIDPTGAHTTRFYPNSPNVPDATQVAVTAGGTTPADVSLPAQTPVGTGATISGTVTEQGTGTPLAGARVVALRASDYSMVRGAVANASGQYSLNVAAGDYKLAFLDSTGLHAMEWFDDLPNTGLGSAVSVTAPGTANAALSPSTGSISGTVTDDLAATPIGGVWVFAIGPAGIAGGTVTALDGTYTIAGLAPGTYRATFADPNGGRLQQYWDDSPDYEGATPFNVTAANTTAGIDAALATPASE